MAYQDVVLADSPYLYYRLDETSGTTANDIGSSGQDGTYSGNFLLAQPPIIIPANGKSVQFNVGAKDGQIFRAGPVDVNFPTTAIAYEAWINFIGTPNAALFDYNVAPPSNDFSILWRSDSRGLSFFLRPVADTGIEVSSNFTDFASAKHVVVNWRSSDGLVEFWINKVLVSTSTGHKIGGSIRPGGEFLIARNSFFDSNFAYEGRMVEVALYTSILPQLRVEAHFDAGFTFDAPGLDIPGVVDFGPAADSLGLIVGAGGLPAPNFYQRILDTGVGFVYYTKVVKDPNPLASETTPNHTNNLVADTHAIIARVD